jgi:hypothetical protein
MTTWSTLIALLSIHLATNYAAVKSVSMRCLNRQRANIVLSHILQTGRVLSPMEVSQKERIFERDGVLRWADDMVIGHCSIGVSMQTLLRRKQAGSAGSREIRISDLMRVYRDQAFIVWTSNTDVIIVLKQGCAPIDQMKAWTQALLLAQKERIRPLDQKDNTQDLLAELGSTLDEAEKIINTYEARLRDVAWDLDVAALETWVGKRIEVETKRGF